MYCATHFESVSYYLSFLSFFANVGSFRKPFYFCILCYRGQFCQETANSDHRQRREGDSEPKRFRCLARQQEYDASNGEVPCEVHWWTTVRIVAVVHMQLLQIRCIDIDTYLQVSLFRSSRHVISNNRLGLLELVCSILKSAHVFLWSWCLVRAIQEADMRTDKTMSKPDISMKYHYKVPITKQSLRHL